MAHLIRKLIVSCFVLMLIPSGNNWYRSLDKAEIKSISSYYEKSTGYYIYKVIPYKDNQILTLCGEASGEDFIECIDTQNNMVKWRNNIGGSYYNAKPKIFDNYLYLPSRVLLCLDMDNGNELFSADVDDPRCDIRSVDYVDDNRVIVSGLNFIASINIKFQKQEWLRTFFDFYKDCNLDSSGDNCFPTVIPQKDYIWFLSKCMLYKIKYSGQILEQHMLDTCMYKGCLDKSGKFLFSVSDKELFCVSLETFKTVWKFSNEYKPKVEKAFIDYNSTTLAYDNERIYCTFDYSHIYNGIICFNAVTGKEIWRKDSYDEQPLGFNDIIFLIDTDVKTQRVSTTLSVLDCKTGIVIKKFGPFEGSSFQNLSMGYFKLYLSFNDLHYTEPKTVDGYIKCYALMR